MSISRYPCRQIPLDVTAVIAELIFDIKTLMRFYRTSDSIKKKIQKIVMKRMSHIRWSITFGYETGDSIGPQIMWCEIHVGKNFDMDITTEEKNWNGKSFKMKFKGGTILREILSDAPTTHLSIKQRSKDMSYSRGTGKRKTCMTMKFLQLKSGKILVCDQKGKYIFVLSVVTDKSKWNEKNIFTTDIHLGDSIVY